MEYIRMHIEVFGVYFVVIINLSMFFVLSVNCRKNSKSTSKHEKKKSFSPISDRRYAIQKVTIKQVNKKNLNKEKPRGENSKGNSSQGTETTLEKNIDNIAGIKRRRLATAAYNNNHAIVRKQGRSRIPELSPESMSMVTKGIDYSTLTSDDNLPKSKDNALKKKNTKTEDKSCDIENNEKKQERRNERKKVGEPLAATIELPKKRKVQVIEKHVSLLPNKVKEAQKSKPLPKLEKAKRKTKKKVIEKKKEVEEQEEIAKQNETLNNWPRRSSSSEEDGNTEAENRKEKNKPDEIARILGKKNEQKPVKKRAEQLLRENALNDSMIEAINVAKVTGTLSEIKEDDAKESKTGESGISSNITQEEEENKENKGATKTEESNTTVTSKYTFMLDDLNTRYKK